MLLELTKKVIDGPDRWVGDARTGLKVVKIRDNLLIYRHGVRKLWVDLEVRLIVAWNLVTQAEVHAFNRLLADLHLEDFYEFVRSGRLVLLNAGGRFYHSGDYGERFERHGRPVPEAEPHEVRAGADRRTHVRPTKDRRQ